MTDDTIILFAGLSTPLTLDAGGVCGTASDAAPKPNAATFLRKEFGLETARISLGHRSAVITEVYAEQYRQKAMEAIVRVG